MACNTREMWVLKLTYYYPDESYAHTLDTYVRIFCSKSVATSVLQDEIRSGWTSEVETEDGYKMLADCIGMSETGEENDKHASWNYSADGTLAWCFYSDGHGYKGEVEKVEIAV